MERKIKQRQPYPHSQNRNRNGLYAKSVTNKIIKALARKGNANPKDQEGEKQNKRKYYWKKWTDPLVIVTIALTFATVALYKEASNQRGEVKEEFMMSNTPYLQISHVMDSLITGPFYFKFEIEKIGKEPTKIVRGHFSASLKFTEKFIQPPVTFSPNGQDLNAPMVMLLEAIGICCWRHGMKRIL